MSDEPQTDILLINQVTINCDDLCAIRHIIIAIKNTYYKHYFKNVILKVPTTYLSV